MIPLSCILSNLVSAFLWARDTGVLLMSCRFIKSLPCASVSSACTCSGQVVHVSTPGTCSGAQQLHGRPCEVSAPSLCGCVLQLALYAYYLLTAGALRALSPPLALMTAQETGLTGAYRSAHQVPALPAAPLNDLLNAVGEGHTTPVMQCPWCCLVRGVGCWGVTDMWHGLHPQPAG